MGHKVAVLAIDPSSSMTGGMLMAASLLCLLTVVLVPFLYVYRGCFYVYINIQIFPDYWMGHQISSQHQMM